MIKFLKAIVTKMPYVKRLLAHLQNLDKSVQSLSKRLDSLDQQNRAYGHGNAPHPPLVKRLEVLEQQIHALQSNNAIQPLGKKIEQMSQEIKTLRSDMMYYFYRGLHPDQYREALCEWYAFRKGKPLDLDNPQTLHEKMQWLKLYEPRELKTLLADKYLMRKWVDNKIGPGHMVPLLGVWDCFEEIDFDTLPNQFVLKANNGSARNIIVMDKSVLDIKQAKDKFSRWMSYNFAYVNGLELHYKDIPPKIIAEKFIAHENGICREYRFYCIHGMPHVVWVADISTQHVTQLRNFYTMDWEVHPAGIIDPDSIDLIRKPKYFDKMVELSKVLTQDISFVRMDFFETENQVYLGEMTFTPASGAASNMSYELSLELGSLLKLQDLS